MNLKQRIITFAKLGEILSDAAAKNPGLTDSIRLRTIMENQYQLNRWFTLENVIKSVKALGSMLRMDKIEKWLTGYSIVNKHGSNKNIGVIMAGNIPLVGFHDFLCVLITGNRFLGKTSSKDNQLIKEVARILTGIDPRFKELIDLSGTNFNYADAIIATGSDNTSRYFEYHYGKKPHIIRKNRNSIAIIDNDTTIEEVRNLGADIFSYFGLGCRNISKIYLPAGFNLSTLSNAWQDYSSIISHPPYNNNYKYNKALYKLNKTRINDQGYFILKEDHEFSSPLSVLFFEYYSDRLKLENSINYISEKIQCILGKNHLPFGSSQYPELWDYADNKDTINFLLSIQ